MQVQNEKGQALSKVIAVGTKQIDPSHCSLDVQPRCELVQAEQSLLILDKWVSGLLSEMVPPTNSNEIGRSGGVYASLGTRQEGGGFGDVGLSLCALPL